MGMIVMEKNVKISMLCNIYGKLLTEKQLAILEDYYDNDLSLSEIAENQNITRQAVRDIIKKGETKLFELEEKLEIMKRMFKQEEKIAIILSELTKIQEKSTDKQIAKILTHVKQELNCLVEEGFRWRSKVYLQDYKPLQENLVVKQE